MNIKISIIYFIALITIGNNVNGQDFPKPELNQSLFPVSPNAAGFAKEGLVPVSLSNGQINYSIPFFQIKSGSLSTSVSLSYYYNGLRPKEDASWVGLGWNATAGGSVTRIVKGIIDGGALQDGFNYDEYNLEENLQNPEQNYDWYMATTDFYFYDMEPDIFVYNFNGHTGKFILYKGKAYTFPYEKLKIDFATDQSYFKITTADGVVYWFEDFETTTPHQVPDGPPLSPFISSWQLTKIVSPDNKDAIYFTYVNATYKETSGAYSQTYKYLTNRAYWNGSTCEPPPDQLSSNYSVSPTIDSKILSSISSREGEIEFTTTSRKDVNNEFPALNSIILKNKLGDPIKKVFFYYGYFGDSSLMYGRLKLDSLIISDPNFIDKEKYAFDYLGEDEGGIAKNTKAIDHWGYYNGATSNFGLIPNWFSSTLPNTADREAHPQYSAIGLIEKITYPSGGHIHFEYEGNATGAMPSGFGPGNRIKNMDVYTDQYLVTPSLSKTFEYPYGVTLITIPDYSPRIYHELYTNQIDPADPTATLYCEYNWEIYKSDFLSSFGGFVNTQFYYTTVNEVENNGNETHITTSTFNSLYDELTTGVDLESQTVFKKLQNGNFEPIKIDSFFYDMHIDTSFLGAKTFKTDYYSNAQPAYYFGNETYQLQSIWKTLKKTKEVIFDGVKEITRVSENIYNPTTRNIQLSYRDGSNGQKIITKTKFPEDYSLPNLQPLKDAYFLNKPVETQLWRKYSLGDSVLLRGQIVVFDNIKFKPTDMYYLETPFALTNLNNESKSNNLYTSLISDSRYVDRLHFQYDDNSNLIQQNLSNNIPISYIWDYEGQNVIADVRNAVDLEIAYTSFESDGNGNWNGIDPIYILTSQGVTGSKFYSRLNFSLSKGDLISTKQYIITYWSDSGPYSVSGTMSGYPKFIKKVKVGTTYWDLYEHKVSGITSVSVMGSGGIDEVRLYPEGSMMTTFTYKPLVGISSQCDANNQLSYFEYDGFGRLSFVRDENFNILKKYCYNFAGQPEDCSANKNPLWVPTGITRCKPCPANNSYISNIQEHQEWDDNQYSTGYHTDIRWIEDGISTNCVPQPDWQTISSTCQLDAQSQNTGNQIQTQQDVNPCSASYNSTRQVTVSNASACPLPCSTSNCFGPDHKCVNGNCEQGLLICTSSVKQKVLVDGLFVWKWLCTFQYCFTDGSASTPFQEYHDTSCSVTSFCLY